MPSKNYNNQDETNKLELTYEQLCFLNILEAIKPADEFDVFYHSETSYLTENILND